MSRSDALAAWEALPIPDTTEEHWRFTNLRDFDPDSFGHGRYQVPAMAGEAMLDLDVAGYATVTADGIEIEKVPEGVTSDPLPEEHERLYSLVGWDEKFAAHNAAMWKHGLLVVVPKGVELEKPLYVQVTSNGGSLYWRMVVRADEGARFAVIEDLSSAGPDTLADSNATGTTGPDLDKVLKGQDPAFIKESIIDPNKQIAPGYSGGIMPGNFGQTLSGAEIDALVKYLSDVTKGG